MVLSKYESELLNKHNINEKELMAKFYYMWRAMSSYHRMKMGAFHKNILEASMLNTVPKNENILNVFKEVSKKNLINIIRLAHLYGNKPQHLYNREINFIKIFLNLDFYLIHFSDNETLEKSGNLELHSRVKLIKDNKIEFNKNNTLSYDINNLADDDFVFFTLSVDINSKDSSRFGKNKYFIKIDDSFLSTKYICMTLDDYAVREGSFSFINGVSKTFKSLFEFDPNYYYDTLLPEINSELMGAVQNKFLLKNDILIGLCYLIIYFNRKIMYKYQKVLLPKNLESLSENSIELKKLEVLINGWLKPIIKIPKKAILSGTIQKIL